jgi:hypothetical protein
MANLAPVKQSKLAAASAKLQRFQAQIAKGKEAGTMVVKNLVTQLEVTASAGMTGFSDQKWGTDDGTGIKQHVLNGVPTAALVAAALDVTAGFGMFGEYQRDAFSLASGALGSFASTAGRKLAVKLERRLDERAKERAAKTPDQIAAPNPNASNSLAVTAAPVAVAQ